jgi:Flp pilus assembly protein TadD
LEEALRKWPDDPAARDALGHALWLQRRVGEALSVFEGTLANHPRREPTLLDAATLALARGDTDRGRELAERLVKADPHNVAARALLAEARLRKGEWSEAAEAARAALRLSPLDVPARRALAVALVRLGRRAEAEAEVRRLVALRPEEGEAIRAWFRELARGKE